VVSAIRQQLTQLGVHDPATFHALLAIIRKSSGAQGQVGVGGGEGMMGGGGLAGLMQGGLQQDNVMQQPAAPPPTAPQYAAHAARQELRSLIASTLHEMTSALGWQVGQMWILDKSSNMLKVFRHSPAEPLGLEAQQFWDLCLHQPISLNNDKQSLPSRVWHDQKPALVDGIEQPAQATSPLYRVAAGFGFKGALGIPVVYQKKCFGVLVFHHHNVSLQPEKLPVLAHSAEVFLKGLIRIFVKACQTASSEVVHHLLPLLLLQASEAPDFFGAGGMSQGLGNGGAVKAEHVNQGMLG